MQDATPSSNDMLHKGVSIIHAMRLTARAARCNRSLSPANREFYRKQEQALEAVEQFVITQLTDPARYI